MTSPNFQFSGQHQLHPTPNLNEEHLSSPQLPPNPFQNNEETKPENVTLEFVTQSSIGASVNSAVDFFNNLRIGDDPFDGPAYTSSISAFSPQLWTEKMDSLRASSVQHSHTLNTKQRWEQEAIDMHNGVWKFVTEQRRTTGVCGCGNSVAYAYSVRTASLNESLLPILSNKFQDLHQFNTRPVYLSLFEQTINEMSVTRYLYSCKHLVAGKYQELKVILEQIFASLSSTTVQGAMSTHTANVLQTLVQYFGALLLQAAQNNTSSTPDLMFDLSGSEPGLPKYSASEFLFKKLLEIKGLSWGCALTHPSIREVVEMSYVSQLIDASLDEIQYIAFLEQIVWSEVSTLSEAEVNSSFLTPFQKGMEKAVKGNMIKLLLLLSKILTIISHYHPRLTLQSLSLMTRSPWPSKIFTAPLLATLSWSTIAPHETVLVFVELYHLFGKRVEEYANKTEQDKALHRHSMGHMMLANQHLLSQIYQIDPPLAALNYGVRYPHLALYRRLALNFLRATAGASQDVPDLAGLILEELFYFGFVYQGLPVGTGPGPSNPPSPPDLHVWLPYLKNEACVQLSLLCRAAPVLASRIVRLIGQSLSVINPAQLLQFLSQTPTPPLAHFVLTPEALNWMLFLITQKTLPTGAADTPQMIDSLITLCVFSPIKSQLPANLAQPALQIGIKLFESIRWEQVPPSTRMKAILVIIAARQAARDWSWKYLLMTNNRKLTSAPFETLFVHKLFQVDSVQGGDELLVAQILLALGMEDDQYRTSSTGGADWLLKWGLVTKLNMLMDRKRLELVRALLVPIMQTLKTEPEVALPHLMPIFTKMLALDRSMAEGIRRIMLGTLSDGSPRDVHEQWVRLWALLLSQKIFAESHPSLLEALIHGYFFEHSGDLSTILPYLSAIEPSKKAISRYSGKFPFITLTVLYRFSPRMPPVRQKWDTDKLVKETALWLTKEEAQGTKDPVLALIFWEAFFHFYFGVEPSSEPLPPAVRETFNKHFNNIVNSNKSLDETLVSIYYSFNTWRDSILFQNGRIFSNPLSWGALSKHLQPPPYTLGTPMPPPAQAQQHAQQLFNADFEYISVLSSDLDDAKLMAMVPLRRTDPMALVESENTRHQAFTQSVSSTIASLSKIDDNKVRGVEDLNKLLRRYTTLKTNLQQEDTEFLQMTRQLYYNHVGPFNVSVACTGSGYCDYPGQVKCMGVNIGPAYPTVREDIQRNRTLFNRDYVSLFDVSRSIAYIAALLEEIVLALIQAGASSQQAGTHLFFTLAPVVLESLLPPNSPIFSSITRVVVSLGDRFIRNRPGLQKRLLQMIIAKSVKGGEGALVTVRTGKVFNEIRANVFELFSPVCLLQEINGLQNYMELLQIFINSTNGLAPIEDLQIATQFGLPANFDMIMAQNPQTIDVILNMTQPLLCKPSINAFAVEVLTLAINYQFPRYFEPVLERLLTLSVQKLITTPWTALLDAIAPRIANLDEETAIQILHKTTQYIPTPPPFFSPILFLAQRLLLHPGIARGIVEGRGGYWDLVVRCLSAATRSNATYFPLSHEDFESVMIFVRDLIVACPVLIEKLWDLFCTILVPYLRADRSADKLTVIKYLNQIPAQTWESASFHAHPSVIREMAGFLTGDAASRCAIVVCHIAGKLDWGKIAGRKDSTTLLHFLRLYFCAGVIRGTDALGQSAREFVRHANWAQIDDEELSREFAGDFFVRLIKDGVMGDEDGSKALMDVLKQFFDIADNSGSLPLAAACMRETRSFVRASFESTDSNAFWWLPLSDQISLIATILIPLARKATQSHPSAAAQDQPNPYTRAMVVSLISVASTQWPDAMPAAIEYAREKSSCAEEVNLGNPKFQEFIRKAEGLVMQFCGSSPTELAVAILKSAVDARLEASTHMHVVEEALHSYFIHAHSDADQEAEFGEKPAGEDQGYKGVPCAKGREILTRAAHALTLPVDHAWVEFIDRCVAGQAILSVRVLLEQQRLHIGNMPTLQWTGFATDLVAYAARCVPIATREFDIYSLWFFGLEVIQDQRWIGGKKSSEASKLFHRHLTLFASPSSIQQLLASKAKLGIPQSTPSQNVQLAAKACALYLERVLTSKKNMKNHATSIYGGDAVTQGGDDSQGEEQGTPKRKGSRGHTELNTINTAGNDESGLLTPDLGSKKDRELFDAAEKLYSVRNDPAYAGLDEFFAKIRDILSPLFDMNIFRNTVVRSLAPIALYLEIL